MDPLRRDERTSYTNNDECRFFAERHKDTKVEVGDYLLLPDIGQSYDVVAVAFYARGSRSLPLVVFEAECAVEGCKEHFQIKVQPRALWNCSGLIRTCKTHRKGGWRSPCRMAWLQGFARDHFLNLPEETKLAKEQARYRAPERERGERKLGVVQREALSVLDMVDVLGLDEEGVIVAVAARLPRGTSLQDQRRTMARNALISVRRRGLAGQLA